MWIRGGTAIHPGALIAGTVDVVGDVECSGKDTPGCWRADERRRERRFVRSNRRGRVPGVEDGDERNTKVTRGDLDEQKLKQVCGLAHEHNLEDIADGFVVMWGICCRPRDMGELQASQVDLKREVVLVRRKTWRKKRMREGEYEAHPIATRGARMLLSRRMTRKGLLFPGWCSRRARAVLKAAAQRYGWEACLLWDGAHTARHGAAADAMAAAIRATRERGGWRTDSSARHYGSLARRGVQKN